MLPGTVKSHIMWMRPSESHEMRLYDPLSGTVAPLGNVLNARPGSAEHHYFHRPALRPAFNWEITSACTWRCSHCYQRTERVLEDGAFDVDDDAMNAALDTLERHEAREVSITGGEPLLARNLASVLTRMRAAFPDIEIRVLASGRRPASRPWFESTAQAIAATGTTVRVPLYGDDARTHDAVTGVPGSLADTTGLVRSLVEADIPVHLAIGLFAQTASRAEDTIRAAAALDPTHLSVSTVLYPRKSEPSQSREGQASPPHTPVTAPQLLRLLTHPSTAALATEYVSLEDQCDSGCRYPTIDMHGRLHACDIMHSPVEGELGDARTARNESCAGCKQEHVCRRCFALADGGTCRAEHSDLVRTAALVVGRRVAQAAAQGYAFLHPDVTSALRPYVPHFESVMAHA